MKTILLILTLLILVACQTETEPPSQDPVQPPADNATEDTGTEVETDIDQGTPDKTIDTLPKTIAEKMNVTVDVNHLEPAEFDDYETLGVGTRPYPKKCNAESDCEFNQICLKCPEIFVFQGKTIYSVDVRPPEKPDVFFTKSTKGLCTSDRRELFIYDYLYRGKFHYNVYCLIKLDNDYVPTLDPEIKKYLLMWKQRLKENGITDKYFEDNIYIRSAFIKEHKSGSAKIGVHYYTIVGDEKIWFQDYSDIKYDLRFAKRHPTEQEIRNNFEIDLKKPIGEIITRQEAQDLLRKDCTPGMEVMRVEYDDKDGIIYASAYDEINPRENKCQYGAVDLEKGEIIRCQETLCRMY
ncbi:hypothetical protein ACFL96_04210 [Thermoproteota archaeon]